MPVNNVRNLGADRRSIKEVEQMQNMLLEGSGEVFRKRNYHNDSEAVHDRNIVQNYVEGVTHAIGEPWQKIARYDQNGDEIRTPFWSVEFDEMVFPDKNGQYKFWNQQYIDKQIEIEEHIEEKVNKMMRFCILNETLCREVLDVSNDYYQWILGAIPGTGKAEVQNAVGLSGAMQKLDGTIVAIKSLPAGSIEQTQALSKLRFVCRLHRSRFLTQKLHKHVKQDAEKEVSNKPNPGMADLFVKHNPNANIVSSKASAPSPSTE
jgi:hypothetical protein